MSLHLINRVNTLKLQREKRRKHIKLNSTLPTPQLGPQSAFLDTQKVDIVLYGGSAGSGKTMGLLLDFAKFIQNPQYGGVIFRRTYPQIRNEGGLWDESSKLYPTVGAIPKESNLEWLFKSGATIRFAHLQHEKNIYDWQGSQLARIGFDELTHFTKKQFFYLLSRNRSTSGIYPQVRATCNPDAESWVASLVDWWIDIEGYPIPERSGAIRWFTHINDELHWSDSKQELRDRFSVEPKSFTFIAAKIYDNPILLNKDPGYLANLQALHPIDKARLLEGNWRIKPESGKIFNRAWFEVVDTVPTGGVIVRFFDLAATAADMKKDAFYTAGVKMKKVGSIYYVLDIVAEQLSPADADNLIVATAQQDSKNVRLRWEKEGGSAGVRDEVHLKSLLSGFDARAVSPRGDKVLRCKPMASEAMRGNVKLLRGEWNDRFLNALHAFDGTSKPFVNDLADSSSGAFTELSKAPIRIGGGAVSYTTW